MKKWEYKVLMGNVNNDVDTPMIDSSAEGWSEISLKSLGEQGWELVSVTDCDDEENSIREWKLLYFKREIENK